MVLPLRTLSHQSVFLYRICPRHPRYREVTKLPVAVRHHGLLTPPRIARSRPQCLRRITVTPFHARTIGWTGVSLSSFPVIAVRGAVPHLPPEKIARPSLRRHGVSADVAFRSSRMEKRTYLANGYSVVKERRRTV